MPATVSLTVNRIEMPSVAKSKLTTAAKLLETLPPVSKPRSSKRRLLSDVVVERPLKVTKVNKLRREVVGWLIGSWDGQIKVKISISLEHYTLIGRHTSCDLVLPSQKVSNFHLRLYAVCTDTAYSFVALQDLSTNGFILNGVTHRTGKQIVIRNRDLGSGKRGIVLIQGDEIQLPGWEGEFVFHQSERHFELRESANNIPFDRSNASIDQVGSFSLGPFLVLDRPIGSGSYGTVNLARHMPTSTLVAVKTISKNKESSSAKASREKEIDVLKRVPSHPGINQLLAAVHDDDHVHLVLELVTGGDLFNYVQKHGSEGLGESEVKWIAFQLLEAVGWLHKHGVAHRDLKSENILLHTSAAYPRLLLADFGLSTFLTPNPKRKLSFVGTQGNIAPELLALWMRDHNYEVNCPRALPEGMDWVKGDIWSLGVVLYTCFAVCHPFDFGSDPDAFGSEELKQVPPASLRRSKPATALVEQLNQHKELIQRVIYGQFDWYPDHRWAQMPEEGRDFVRSLIEPDPAKRMTIRGARAHAWMQSSNSDLDKLWTRVVLGGEVVGLARK